MPTTTETSSQSVAVLGGATTPLAYPIATEGTITVLAATATLTANPFDFMQPCLSFYDSDGNLISRADAPSVDGGESIRVSWFPGAVTIADNVAALDQEAGMAPRIDLDLGCQVVFEAFDADGDPSTGVTIADALLRVETAMGTQIDVGPYMLVPGPQPNVPEPEPGTSP